MSSIGNNAIGVQNPGQSAEFINYPPVCQQDKCPVRTLQLEAGSSFQGSGCSLGVLGTRVTMSIPSIQYDRESYDQDSRSSRVPLSCSSNLASLLYSLEQCKYPLVIEGRMLFPSHLIYLRQGLTEQDVSDWVTSLLLQSW